MTAVGLASALAQQSVPADGGVVIGLHGPVHTVQEEFTAKDTKGIGRSWVRTEMGSCRR
jgi:hypothetical protein